LKRAGNRTFLTEDLKQELFLLAWETVKSFGRERSRKSLDQLLEYRLTEYLAEYRKAENRNKHLFSPRSLDSMSSDSSHAWIDAIPDRDTNVEEIVIEKESAKK